MFDEIFDYDRTPYQPEDATIDEDFLDTDDFILPSNCNCYYGLMEDLIQIALLANLPIYHSNSEVGVDYPNKPSTIICNDLDFLYYDDINIFLFVTPKITIEHHNFKQERFVYICRDQLIKIFKLSSLNKSELTEKSLYYLCIKKELLEDLDQEENLFKYTYKIEKEENTHDLLLSKANNNKQTKIKQFISAKVLNSFYRTGNIYLNTYLDLILDGLNTKK